MKKSLGALSSGFLGRSILVVVMVVSHCVRRQTSLSVLTVCFVERRDDALLNDGDLVPVVLVVAGVLAKVDGGDLEDAVARQLALAGLAGLAAERGATPLVLGARGLGLLGLGERGRGDRAEGQEVEKGGSVGRHFDNKRSGCFGVRCCAGWRKVVCGWESLYIKRAGAEEFLVCGRDDWRLWLAMA